MESFSFLILGPSGHSYPWELNLFMNPFVTTELIELKANL